MNSSFCEEGFIHQHSIYQLGGCVYVIGLIVPSNIGRPQTLWLRFILAATFLCYAVLGGPVLCLTDMLSWNGVCFLVNLLHGIHLAHAVYPVKLDDDLRVIYAVMFANFKISKRVFKNLTTCADAMVYELKTSGKYAIEGRTNCSRQLSLLVRGRMRVSRGGQFLHYIRGGQFIDSPEWEAVKEGASRSFQVTIEADTDCHYLQWSRQKLEAYLKRHSLLQAVMESAIGKDITDKLYSIGETEIDTILFVGVEGEVSEEHETVQLLVPADDQLLAHRWERATSLENEQPVLRPKPRSPSGTTYLTVPGAEDTGSNLSLHRRSIVDVRASMASSKRGSTLSSDGGDFLTPPQSFRESFASSPGTPTIMIE